MGLGSSESGKKVTSGSLEFVGGREPGSIVHVVVQLPEMPRYHEQNLVDQITAQFPYRATIDAVANTGSAEAQLNSLARPRSASINTTVHRTEVLTRVDGA